MFFKIDIILLIFSWSLTPGDFSTPLFISNAAGCTVETAFIMFSGFSPPDKIMGDLTEKMKKQLPLEMPKLTGPSLPL